MNPEAWKKNPNRKAILIARESKKGEGKISHDVQEKKSAEHCREHGLILDKKQIRISESAKRSETRLKYQKAIEYALDNDIRHILFYLSDREARNLTDVERNEQLVLDDRIVIHYITMGKVLHKDSSPSDFFMRDIDAVMNKNFSRMLKVRMIDVMTQKAESGWAPYNHIPLGYAHIRRKDSEGKELKRGTTIGRDPDEQRVKIVQREFELRATTGYSADAIAKMIKKEGLIPPKMLKNYSWKGVLARLQNKFYWGKFDWRGTEHPGKHELIIDRRTLDIVKASFGNGKRARRLLDKQGAFSGMLTCGHSDCGRAVTYEPKIKTLKSTGQKKEYPYYRCSNSRKVHPSLVYVSESQVWEQIQPAVDQVSISESYAQQVADFLNEVHQQAKAAHRADADNYRKAVEGIDIRSKELISDYVGKKISAHALNSGTEQLQAERRYYTDLMLSAQEAIGDVVMVTVKKVLELCTNAKTLWNHGTSEESSHT